MAWREAIEGVDFSLTFSCLERGEKMVKREEREKAVRKQERRQQQELEKVDAHELRAPLCPRSQVDIS